MVKFNVLSSSNEYFCFILFLSFKSFVLARAKEYSRENIFLACNQSGLIYGTPYYPLRSSGMILEYMNKALGTAKCSPKAKVLLCMFFFILWRSYPIVISDYSWDWSWYLGDQAGQGSNLNLVHTLNQLLYLLIPYLVIFVTY